MGRDLDQAELDVVDRQRLFRFGVKAPQRSLGARPAGRAFNAESCAAARDRDVERGLDLAQVRVQRTAEIRERAIVERASVTLRARERVRRVGRQRPRSAITGAARRAPALRGQAPGATAASDALAHDRRLQRLVERREHFGDVRPAPRSDSRGAVRRRELGTQRSSRPRAAAHARRRASTPTA